MRITVSIITLSLFSVLTSCGGKNKKSSETVNADTTQTAPVENNSPAADTTLAPVRSFIEKDLAKWAQSFKGFSIDSFRFNQKSDFGDVDNDATSASKEFYDLFGPSLVYSADSSQFIDLYSAGLSLEKKGKKIIAISDVDNGVTWHDKTNKTWKRILFFGPSAWVEEVVWTSPTTFILAGVGPSNDVEENTAFLMLGDTKTKTFRSFESRTIRLQSTKYEATGLSKLKIDEWE